MAAATGPSSKCVVSPSLLANLPKRSKEDSLSVQFVAKNTASSTRWAVMNNFQRVERES